MSWLFPLSGDTSQLLNLQCIRSRAQLSATSTLPIKPPNTQLSQRADAGNQAQTPKTFEADSVNTHWRPRERQGKKGPHLKQPTNTASQHTRCQSSIMPFFPLRPHARNTSTPRPLPTTHQPMQKLQTALAGCKPTPTSQRQGDPFQVRKRARTFRFVSGNLNDLPAEACKHKCELRISTINHCCPDVVARKEQD